MGGGVEEFVLLVEQGEKTPFRSGQLHVTGTVPLDRGDNVVELQWQTPGRSLAWLSALTVALISAMLVLERRRQ